MRHLSFALIIAVMAFTSLNVEAEDKQAIEKSIQFEELVEMLATDGHWDNQNLLNIGLEELIYETEEAEGGGDFYYFIYGNNVIAQTTEDYSVNLTETGSHAFAIEVTLMTDNDTKLYFKEKSDHDEFMRCVRQSSEYENYDGRESVGLSLIEDDEFTGDWYIISIHGG